MDNRSILFFDSGVGGLPYLASARAALPMERFVYVADRQHYPYGQKEPAVIRTQVLESIGLAINRIPVKACVVACNTASVTALELLRRTFPIPFVGVVPAIKPAAALTKNGRIGILATPQTVNNDYLTGLINDFASTNEVLRVPAPELRDLVEERFFTASADEKNRIVADAVSQVIKADVDVLVIGCTHFLHVMPELSRALGEKTVIIDSRDGVTNQLVRILEINSLSAGDSPDSRLTPGRPQAIIYLTGDRPVEERYRLFARSFNIPGVEILA